MNSLLRHLTEKARDDYLSILFKEDHATRERGLLIKKSLVAWGEDRI